MHLKKGGEGIDIDEEADTWGHRGERTVEESQPELIANGGLDAFEGCLEPNPDDGATDNWASWTETGGAGNGVVFDATTASHGGSYAANISYDGGGGLAGTVDTAQGQQDVTINGPAGNALFGDSLAVAKRDRLSRSVMLAGWAEMEIRRRGARLAVAERNGHEQSPQETLLAQILDSFSEFEKQRIQGRTKEALHQKRERGEKNGGRCPLGYRISGTRTVQRRVNGRVCDVEIPLIEPVPEIQAKIVQARAMRAEVRPDGRPVHSLRKLAAFLGLATGEAAKRVIGRPPAQAERETPPDGPEA